MSFYSLWDQLTRGTDEKMPEKATHSVESQIEELQQVAAKRLILIVLDGVYSLFMLRFYSFPLFLISDQTCGTRSTNGLSRASTLPLRRSFWWYVGLRRVVGSLLMSGCWIQTTRIKGIMRKGLEVELELLGVQGTATAHILTRPLTRLLPQKAWRCWLQWLRSMPTRHRLAV